MNLKKNLCLSLLLMGFCLPAFALQETDFEAKYDLNVPNDEAVKSRQKRGTAYVDFLTGKSTISKTYHNNQAELAKIETTISDVRNDKDITIKSISITGYASPEGTESMNNQLSGDRTRSLADYIRKNFRLPVGIPIETKAGGEDWELLRSEVEKSNIADKAQILAIIDDRSLSSDEKDKKIQGTYPKEYKWIYDNIFPKLRRSVYVIDYTVRDYTDLKEIREIADKNPQKLSLYEIYQLVNKYKMGTDDFYRYIFLGARMFPHNTLANLNAGAASIAKKDYSSALTYLSKSGTSELANYNRGVYYGSTGNYTEALNYFNQARGIDGAGSYIRMIEGYTSPKSSSYDDGPKYAKEPKDVKSEEVIKMPNYLKRSNLDVETGFSIAFGGYAGLKYYTPNFNEELLSKAYLSADIGKGFIAEHEFKDRITWNIGAGYILGWYNKSYTQAGFYTCGINVGKSSLYEKTTVTLNLLGAGYIYKRLKISADVLGFSMAGGKDSEGKENFNYEFKLNISLRLF